MAARLNEGDTAGSILPTVFGQPAIGLLDAQAAEVHLLIRSHGPKIPGLVDQMISTFNGGCVQANNAPGTGTPGSNTCVDMQGTNHVP